MTGYLSPIHIERGDSREARRTTKYRRRKDGDGPCRQGGSVASGWCGHQPFGHSGYSSVLAGQTCGS